MEEAIIGVIKIGAYGLRESIRVVGAGRVMDNVFGIGGAED